MPQPTQPPPCLLVVEDDEATHAILLDVLTEEGYAVASATSLDEALAQINRQVFDLILTDVIAWTLDAPLHSLERLRDLAQPTPVGLVSGWHIVKEAARDKGFAFVLKKPFELDDLLTLIAEYVARPLTAEQECQAEVVRRYCQSIDAHNWQACVALCHEDVRYYPSPGSPFDRQQDVFGRTALLEQLAYNTQVAPDFHYESYSLYGRPDGIAVRYLATIATPEGRKPLVGSILFQVAEGQVIQIGYRLDADHLRAWTLVQQKQSAREA